MKLLKLSMLLLVVCWNSNAANDIQMTEEIKSCQDRFKSRMDYARCLDSSLNDLDRIMKTWENNLEFKLKDLRNNGGNPDAMGVFIKSAKEYKKYRKANCQWQYLALLPDVTSASALLKECQIAMTKDRIEKLKLINEYEF
jgi:uncharacterized protein YecT (DUF1311 family)